MGIVAWSRWHLCLAGLASATILYEGGTVIAHDGSTQLPVVLRGAHVVVEGTRVVELSEGAFNGELSADATRLDAIDEIPSPGFIETRE